MQPKENRPRDGKELKEGKKQPVRRIRTKDIPNSCAGKAERKNMEIRRQVARRTVRRTAGGLLSNKGGPPVAPSRTVKVVGSVPRQVRLGINDQKNKEVLTLGTQRFGYSAS